MCGQNKLADVSWRINTNEESNKLITGKNVVRKIKSGRIAWLGYSESMEENRKIKEIMERKLILFRFRKYLK
jgi:hypothetical protein